MSSVAPEIADSVEGVAESPKSENAVTVPAGGDNVQTKGTITWEKVDGITYVSANPEGQSAGKNEKWTELNTTTKNTAALFLKNQLSSSVSQSLPDDSHDDGDGNGNGIGTWRPAEGETTPSEEGETTPSEKGQESTTEASEQLTPAENIDSAVGSVTDGVNSGIGAAAGLATGAVGAAGNIAGKTAATVTDLASSALGFFSSPGSSSSVSSANSHKSKHEQLIERISRSTEASRAKTVSKEKKEVRPVNPKGREASLQQPPMKFNGGKKTKKKRGNKNKRHTRKNKN